MRRESHVRFREGGGVQFPSATRPVIVCEHKEDAERILGVLPRRFEKYGLRVHPEKTRLVEFRPPSEGGRKGTGTFTFLGLKHFWMKSRRDRWVVGRKTDGARLGRALRVISVWCRRNMHAPVTEQHVMLSRKLRGHYGYYGITFNLSSLRRFYHEVRRIWFKRLRRRSSKTNLTWARFGDYLSRVPLPLPRVMHSSTANP